MYIWQTKEWGEMLKTSKQANKIININGIQIEKRKISFNKFGLFIIGIQENTLLDLIKKNKNLLIDLKKLCKKEKCIFIQIETINYNKISKQNFEGFKNSYYKKFITPYSAIIDLNKDNNTILSEMKPKGRYNIRLATKKGIIIKEVEKNSSNIKEFYDLMQETTKRNGFNGNKIEFYENFLKNITNSKLLLAYYENKVIASGIFIIDKEISIYYYGASTSDRAYRNLMAPFLLQWEAINIAKNNNSKIYDFLGIANPKEKNSSLAGVTDFKMKLTKNKINLSDSYIYINNKFIYYTIKLLKKLFHK